MSTSDRAEIWLAAGVRTPFAKVDGALAKRDAIELSVPVVRHMLFHIKALESAEFLRDKARVDVPMGTFLGERMNPNGGSVALDHPFGATGARILSQAVKELSDRAGGERAIVSICTDAGQGTVALLEAA